MPDPVGPLVLARTWLTYAICHTKKKNRHEMFKENRTKTSAFKELPVCIWRQDTEPSALSLDWYHCDSYVARGHLWFFCSVQLFSMEGYSRCLL